MAQSFKIYQIVLNKIFYSRNAEKDHKHEGLCLWRIRNPQLYSALVPRNVFCVILWDGVPLNWCILRMWYIIIKWTWHRPLEYGWARIQSVLNLWSGYAKSAVKLSVWEHQHDQTGDMCAGVQCVCQSVSLSVSLLVWVGVTYRREYCPAVRQALRILWGVCGRYWCHRHLPLQHVLDFKGGFCRIVQHQRGVTLRNFVRRILSLNWSFSNQFSILKAD